MVHAGHTRALNTTHELPEAYRPALQEKEQSPALVPLEVQVEWATAVQAVPTPTTGGSTWMAGN